MHNGFCPNVTVTSVDISAEVYNFKEANEVLENQVENCDVEKVKTEPEEVKLLVRLSSNFSTSQPST